MTSEEIGRRDQPIWLAVRRMPGQKVGKVDCSNWRRAGKGLSLGLPAEFFEGFLQIPQALLISFRFRGTRAELIDCSDML